MKIRLTFKTPDVSAYALQDLYLRFKDEGLERVQKSISKYTRDDEYLMIETDYKDEEEREEALEKAQRAVITSYSIHYTKLYDTSEDVRRLQLVNRQRNPDRAVFISGYSDASLHSDTHRAGWGIWLRRNNFV